MSEINRLIGERIRLYRKKAGLTQEALAEKAGLHGSYISQLERGVKSATLETLECISEGLGIRFEMLFENLTGKEDVSDPAYECYQRILQMNTEHQVMMKRILDQLFSLWKVNGSLYERTH